MKPGLTSKSILRLSDCGISVTDDGLTLSAPAGKSLTCRTDVLELLAFFGKPRSLSEAARQPAMAHDWVHSMRTILALIETGVLEVISGPGSAQVPQLDPKGFGGAAEHMAMLNDRERTGKYIEAIRRIVNPGDTVIDLGCGTGVLAAAAARAGAGRVHAIERSRIASVADAMFRQNHLAGTIELHRAAARDIELDEPADLLVTELVGNEPLSERILEHTIDVKTRLLKPGATIIPAGVDIYAQCLNIETDFLNEYRLSSANLERWNEWYGFDFKALGEIDNNVPFPVDASPRLLSRSRPGGEAVLIQSIDLDKVTSATLEVAASLPADSDVNAVWVSFVIRLDEELSISRLFGDLAHPSSWNCRLWLPPDPIPRGPGGTVDIVYRHDPLGSRMELPPPCA